MLGEEFRQLQPFVRLTTWLIGLLPTISFIRTRNRLLRASGWRIAPDVAFFGVPRLYGRGDIRSRLTVGPRAMLNVGCTFELNADVTIGEDAAMGHEVLVLTSTHRLGRRGRRAGVLERGPVTVEAGAWIGSRVVILPGVRIGAGAVVMAGSLVNADVAEGSLVAGVPAEVVVPRLPG